MALEKSEAVNRFRGCAALVTGGASGIGREIVRRLVAEGARVVVADINQEALRLLEGEHLGYVRAIPTDVSVEEDVARAVALAISEYGRLDAAFNVAGGPGLLEPIHKAGSSGWRRVLDANLFGVFFAMKCEAKQMIAQGQGGVIVNVSSLNATVPAFGASSYCVAKTGVEMLTKCGALELGIHNIRVNAISPGLTLTPLTEQSIPPPMKTAILDRVPLGRAATPADQAAAALFLASSEATYITGVSLSVDGGWVMSAFPNLRSYYKDPDVANIAPSSEAT